MALRLGGSAALGSASGAAGDDLGRRYSGQFSFAFDIGAKAWRHVFLGGYLLFGFGSEGSDDRVHNLCNDRDNNLQNDIACSVVAFRFGAEGAYYFAPDARVDPWLGYGIGFNLVSQNIDDRPSGRSETTTASGWDLAVLGAGVDFRLVKAFGLGPYAEAAVGRYTRTETSVNGTTTYNGGMPDPAVHAWLDVGLRVVLFP